MVGSEREKAELPVQLAVQLPAIKEQPESRRGTMSEEEVLHRCRHSPNQNADRNCPCISL